MDTAWRSITFYKGSKSPIQLLTVLHFFGCRTTEFAEDIIRKNGELHFSANQELKLVIASPAGLGFTDRAIRKDVYARAKENGLFTCQAMTGPFLRLQYLDQPDGEFLEIAMEPIIDSQGNPRVFDLVHHKDCPPSLGTEAVEYFNDPTEKGPRTIDPQKKLVFRV